MSDWPPLKVLSVSRLVKSLSTGRPPMLLQHNMDHGGVPILGDFRPVPHIEIFFWGGGGPKNIYLPADTGGTRLWGQDFGDTRLWGQTVKFTFEFNNGKILKKISDTTFWPNSEPNYFERWGFGKPSLSSSSKLKLDWMIYHLIHICPVSPQTGWTIVFGNQQENWWVAVHREIHNWHEKKYEE